MQPAKKEKTRKAHKELLETAYQLKESGLCWYEVAEKLDLQPQNLSALRSAYGLTELADQSVEEGINLNKVSNYWVKSKHISIHVKGGEELVSYEDVRQEMIAEMQRYSPKYKKIKRKRVKDPHMLVLDPADVHIGKLATMAGTGGNYNHEIAIERLLKAVDGILTKVDSINFNKIILVVGNDILHVDTPNNTTTKGTQVQTSTTWHEAFKIARKAYVQIIERLVGVADVEVVFNPSNHDYVLGYALTDALYCWFHGLKNVSFDSDIRHRKYTSYGKNLICTSHGDGAKEADYPMLMAHEASEYWSNSQFRYVYLHHIHHKKQVKYANGKDYIGVSIEYLRSPSDSDEWHDKHGYVGAKKAIEAFVHHPEKGQVMRITETVE